MFLYNFRIIHLNLEYILSIACLLLSSKINLRLSVYFIVLLIMIFLCIFICLCFPFLHPYYAHKLDFHASPCVSLGYSSSHLGYRYLNLASQRVYVSFYVRFHEDVFSFTKSKQIAEHPNTSSHPIHLTHLPNLITSLIFSLTTPSVYHTSRPPNQATHPPTMFAIIQQHLNLTLMSPLVYIIIIL